MSDAQAGQMAAHTVTRPHRHLNGDKLSGGSLISRKLGSVNQSSKRIFHNVVKCDKQLAFGIYLRLETSLDSLTWVARVFPRAEGQRPFVGSGGEAHTKDQGVDYKMDLAR